MNLFKEIKKDKILSVSEYMTYSRKLTINKFLTTTHSVTFCALEFVLRKAHLQNSRGCPSKCLSFETSN